MTKWNEFVTLWASCDESLHNLHHHKCQMPNALLLLTASETGTSSSAGRKSPGMQDQILAKCGSSKTLKKKVSCNRPDDFWGEKNVVNHHKPSPLEVYDWHMKKTAPRPQRQITPTPRCSMKTIGFSPTNWVFGWISEFPQENPSDENGELNVEIGATEWAEPGNSRLRRQRPDGLGPENG